jgi:amino acid transporter
LGHDQDLMGIDKVITSDYEATLDQVGLKGSLGVTSIVLIVLASAAPLSVMIVTSPLLISMGNGAAAPFDALVATLTMLLFTVGFVTMSRYITNAGAFYAFIQKGLGRSIGLGSATTALISYFLILLAIEAYMGYAIAE